MKAWWWEGVMFVLLVAAFVFILAAYEMLL
jgi:hypothetical protein